ncbi:farnesol dehydrogenase-like [Neodiprion fabricii]|uniref:farnesol dehydrogenase-like n=1 Tax=Neodiprion fabricii TaxID=2872261 RepID=UPI001ED982C7|nr:farnesol dehydrogenase-like [Neodiprion fabricii]
MDRWVGKVAVVTGASAGIGAAIAEALVKEGLLVVGFARRQVKLEVLAKSFHGLKGKFYVKQCDVSNEEDLVAAFNWVKTELGGIDVLVNNAGVINSRKFLDDDIPSLRNMLNVNFVATAIGTQEAVASMRSRKVPGHIININSVAGHVTPPVPMAISAYCSTKYAVTALTETVRKELAAANAEIKITSLSPGFVATEILQKASYDATILEKFRHAPHLEPKDISDAVVYVLGTPQNVQITELTIRPLNEAM